MHVAPPKFVPEVLLLNISKIDDEHEAIFDLLASVKDRYLETGAIPSEQIEHILDTLKEHFATEELLARTATQDFSPHARKHEELLRTVTGLLEMIRHGKSDAFALLRYVEYWCERHIGEQDKPLGIMLHR